MAPARCCVNGCRTTKLNTPDCTQFKLPRDRERRAAWLRLINREDVLDKPPHYYTVCELHFRPREVLVSDKRKLLLAAALPSRNLPSPPASPASPAPSNHSMDALIAASETATGVVTSRYRQVPLCALAAAAAADLAAVQASLDDSTSTTSTTQSAIAAVAAAVAAAGAAAAAAAPAAAPAAAAAAAMPPRDIALFKNLSDSLLTKDLAELVKQQIRVKNGPTENNLTLEDVLFYINAYYAHPQSYNLLRNALNFPNLKKLKYEIKKVGSPLTTELNEAAMSVLELKVKHMSSAEKICSVMIGEIDLKPHLYYNITDDLVAGFHEVDGWQTPEPARGALVLQARGLGWGGGGGGGGGGGCWAQPAGFALLAPGQDEDELSAWLEKTLAKLIDIGLDVRALVTQLEPETFKLTRNVTENTPYFLMEQRKNIYYVYDPPFLFEELRNTFTQNTIRFKGANANHKHVARLLEENRNNCYDVLLTTQPIDKHLKTTNTKNALDRRAGELFSIPMTVGLSNLIDTHEVEPKATIQFIKEMSVLYDVLINFKTGNPSSLRSKEAQLHYLAATFNDFTEMKVLNEMGRELDVTSCAKFIRGFKITLAAIMRLTSEVGWLGDQFTKIKSVNQNALNNLFSKMRASEPDLTCRKFTKAFQEHFYDALIKPPKGCIRKDQFRQSFIRNRVKQECSKLVHNNSEDAVGATGAGAEMAAVDCVAQAEYYGLRLPARGALLLACSHLLRRCAQKHACLTRNYHQNLSSYKRYAHFCRTYQRSLPIPPSDEFINFVESMEEVFLSSFVRLRTGSRLAAGIVERVRALPAPRVPGLAACACACASPPRRYLENLFVRMRLYHTFKANDEAFKSSGYTIKYFSLYNLGS